MRLFFETKFVETDKKMKKSLDTEKSRDEMSHSDKQFTCRACIKILKAFKNHIEVELCSPFPWKSCSNEFFWEVAKIICLATTIINKKVILPRLAGRDSKRFFPSSHWSRKSMLKVLMDLGLLSDNFLWKCFSNLWLQGNSLVMGSRDENIDNILNCREMLWWWEGVATVVAGLFLHCDW